MQLGADQLWIPLIILPNLLSFISIDVKLHIILRLRKIGE